MTTAGVKVIPRKYGGQWFRSSLEAYWACTLDFLRIAWLYELEGVELPSGERYLPDFYLPGIKTWLEVKGAHDERTEKTRELARVVMGASADWFDPAQYVVIGRTERGWRQGNYRALFDVLDVQGQGVGEDSALLGCRRCGQHWYCDFTRSYRCRACDVHEGDHHIAHHTASGAAPLATPDVLRRASQVKGLDLSELLGKWGE